MQGAYSTPAANSAVQSVWKKMILFDMWGGRLFVVANELDCNILISEIKLQLHYDIHFWMKNSLGKGIISPSKGQIVSLPSFYKSGFGIK